MHGCQVPNAYTHIHNTHKHMHNEYKHIHNTHKHMHNKCQVDMLVVTLFCTREQGVLLEDSFPLPPFCCRLMAVHMPFFYFVLDNVSSVACMLVYVCLCVYLCMFACWYFFCLYTCMRLDFYVSMYAGRYKSMPAKRTHKLKKQQNSTSHQGCRGVRQARQTEHKRPTRRHHQQQ